MSRLRTLLIVVIVLSGPTLVTAEGGSQVDQEWLRQWTAAQSARPPSLETAARIAHETEPGSPLFVDGQVFQPDGVTPAPDVVVFAYQTDRQGLYSPRGTGPGTWRLKGWARTGSDGRFRFRTIRPGAYPDRSEPAHIHFTVESEVYGRQWASTLFFADDPLVTEQATRASAAAGRFGAVAQVADDGRAMARAEIALRLKTRPDF